MDQTAPKPGRTRIRHNPSLSCSPPLPSADRPPHPPDPRQQPGRSRDKAAIDAANLVALDREVRAALALAQGNGMIAINVMRAVSEYAHYVRQSCESGVQAIVVGAGLPLDLPEMVSDFPDLALIPIISDSRGIAVVVQRGQR